ncbi:MAG: hypothetical protein LQ341_006666, partial [Variospora aurantia]
IASLLGTACYACSQGFTGSTLVDHPRHSIEETPMVFFKKGTSNFKDYQNGFYFEGRHASRMISPAHLRAEHKRLAGVKASKHRSIQID